MLRRPAPPPYLGPARDTGHDTARGVVSRPGGQAWGGWLVGVAGAGTLALALSIGAALAGWVPGAYAQAQAQVEVQVRPPIQTQPGLPASPVGEPFDFERLTAQARGAAQLPWREPADAVPAALRDLGYDELREIRFRPEAAWWRAQGLPFEIQAFHLGGGLRHTVALHEIVEGRARPLAHDPSHWDFGRLQAERPELLRWQPPGHAGFRVHHALNRAGVMDELVVFLGASYFRALGQGQLYGLSARGLAIDTVGAPPGQGEEFPRFSAFWLERPAPDATALVVLAQMDSPRATGAYRFVLRPGAETVMDVQARIFLRPGAAPLHALGIAPLTSMFQHGENQPRPGEFRPEVHDSDGLLVAAVGPGGTAVEWLWRPLFNPPQPMASSFSAQRLHGFGLMQRDRAFASYEDTEARYERRPSAWVEPLSDWGPGQVLLLQLPTPDETHDNVVAYWQPATLPQPGQALALDWRLRWQGDAPTAPPHGWTVQSRAGRGWAEPAPGELQFLIDFDGPALRALPPLAQVPALQTDTDLAVELVASVGPGARITDTRAWPHPLGGWRAQLRVQRLDPTRPLELRAFLRRGAETLTETWTALVPQE